MTEDSVWGWLQSWYAIQCDGTWEHEYGVKIDTLDNPGWSVTVDLSGTTLAGLLPQERRVDRSQDDWLHCAITSDHKFVGAGDPSKLTQLVQVFREWADAHFA